MSRIRVLVIDDAVVIRKILSDTISADPDLEVVGTAANGRIGLQKIAQVNPDVITLDVEMPEMNGLETLRQIRKDYPKLPVIMFSTLTERGANATFEALALGATDYVTKPANVGSVTNAREAVEKELIRKIKELTSKVKPLDAPKRNSVQPSLEALPQNIKPVSRPASTQNQIDVLAIGVSTGGPNALAFLIPKLPEDLGIPVFIVQHMPPMFTRLLAERLNSQSKLKVVEASDGMIVTPGTVYIAPGDYHLEVFQSSKGVHTKLQQSPPENSCRPAVDVLFRSVVSVYGANILGVILTGMGHDGLRGCELIKDKGGVVLAQDKATSVVWGMPGYVAEAGLADLVLPLETIPLEIVRRKNLCRSGSLLSSSLISIGGSK